MKLKILAGAFILIAMFATTGAAQQDPLDLGLQDSAFFVISEPIVGAVDQVVTAELYFWNDAQDLTSVAFGFGWDNPNFQMEGTPVWSPDAMSAFNMMQLALYRSNLDSTNVNQKFQCVAMRMMGTGLVRSTTAKLVVTYTFRVSSWSETDQFCIETKDFSTNTFVDTDGSNEYPPMFDGPFCVGNIPTGILEVDPATLGFTGVATEANPSTQNILVAEAGGQYIDFDLATDAGWINLPATTGTTPQDMTVSINNAGLGAGDYVDSIHVTSGAATNDAWVIVNLHLDAPNQAPILDPIGDQSGPENSLIEFTITASDPDETIPSLTNSTLPGTATFTDNGNGTGTFSWTTTYDDAGSYPITFTVSDGDLTDQETIIVRVFDVNRDPVLDPIADQQVLEGENLNFIVTASDPDMEPLGIEVTSLPGTASFTIDDNGIGTFDWTPGNTDAGFHYVTFTVYDMKGSTDSQTVTIEVIDADGFILDPNPLVFAADFGSVGPWEQTFSVTVSDGSMIDFTASTDASWFTLSSGGGTTPSSITVFVDITGLAAGFYHDSILIAGTGLDPVYEDVELTISNNLVVDPVEFTLTVSEGEMFPVEQYIAVTEMGGDAIAYEATTEATWLTFAVGGSSGTTPGTIQVACLPANIPSPGVYNSTIIVTGDAANSPITIPVTLNVTECPTLAPAEVVYEHMAIAGETVMFDEIIALTSSGPGEIEWETTGSMAYTFDPITGTTPGDLGVHYEQMFDTEGMYSDTAYVNSVTTGTFSCPSEVMIITNVMVNRPPSADTIIVESLPAVPGMRVGVPVIFTNSCRLTGLGFSLNWANGLHLDSVSFTGSAVEYVDNKVVEINNDLDDVKITADIGDQMMVPIGSKQLLATLFFALPCEIEDGAYEFSLGATPPLEPADVYFYRDCGGGVEVEFPEPVSGSIVVGSASNFVCGYVVDPDFNEIPGATVELWEDYPFTTPLLTTTSSGIGSFAFDELMVIPFDLYAYKEGYYPGSFEDINFGDKGIMIILEPLPETPIWPSQYVDYYCPDSSSTFLGTPLPVGAVVEAYSVESGLLVGQKSVTTSGVYGFMPVYADWDEVGDDGAKIGETIRFTINGMDAIATGNTTYPDFTIYDRMEVCLEVRGTVEKVCTLFEGWNLISWNVNTETDDILTVLDPVMEYVNVVLGFEQGGLTFDPDLQTFSTLWDVDHYSGYWVRIEGISEVALTIAGLPVAETTPIALTTGWNLVSYLPEESWPTETALSSVVDVVQFAYGFPSGNIQVWTPSGTFNQLETFDPCNGYWIKTTADAWLTYDNSVPPVTSPRPQQQELALSSRIAQANWVNLYSKNLTVDDQVVTTGATITAHAVKNDNLVGTFTMTADGQFGFMPVYASAPGETVTGLQAGEEFYLAVNDITTDEVFTWTNNGDRIEVSELSTANSIGEVLPEGYSLAQNYPNPFNPSTSIAFYMPVTGHVKVEIYNVLGRSIAVIFDGQAQAGENKVVWDGRDTNGDATASGVYFYRLTADKYTETRKMMLLK